MNLRRFFSWLLCICFMLSPIHSLAWASTGYSTPSNAFVASASNAEYEELYNDLLSFSSVPVASASNAGVMLLGDDSGESVYSMFSSIASTIDDWSDVYLYINYTDEYGTHGKSTPLSADGGYGIARMDWTDLTSFGETFTLNYLAIQISKDALPPAGTYTCDFGIGKWSSYNNFEYRDSRVYSRKLISNANYEESFDFISSYHDGYRVVLVPFNLDVGNTSYIEWRIYPEPGAALPVRLNVRLEFTKTSDTADIVAAGGSYTSTDAAADTAQNTAQIAQNTADVNDTLKEIITHISDQLAALWDQMYNLMHVPQLANDDKNTGLITDSIETQMENDNENTDQVTTAIEDHGNFIIEGLKSLFIPSDEYFKSWFDDMYAFFNDRLGFLMLPADVLMEFIDIFTSSSEEFAGIPFPEFKWIDGTVVIPAQTVGFDFLNSDWGKELQNKLYFVGNVIMIGSLFALIQRKLKEVTEQ